MSDRVSKKKKPLHTVMRCKCTSSLTDRLSSLHLVVPPDGNFKLCETGSCLPLCFLSVSLHYLSPLRDSPSLTHFSQNTSFSENVCSFFCIRRPCSLTTSEGNGAAEKWLPPWQAWRPLSCISQCYFVNIWGQVNTYQSSCSREDACHVL